ncbi:MAG: alcohol dehydrogenase catalytic domain-containing protein [Anaerolineae bacterium]|nr:alcohol dehydrogenase catalytic domain-containing protein [Anaerolineae bacterium]
MRALYFIASIPRYVLTKISGSLDKRFFWSALSCLQYGQIPEPSLPSQEWVRVKTTYGGICGSDLGVITLHTSPVLSAISSPVFVLGHENVGVVVEKGEKAGEVELGQRVVVDPTLSCETRGFLDRCPMCKEGKENLCHRVTEGNLAPGLLIGSCQDTGGSWGEYFVAHYSKVYPVPDGVSDEEAVMVEPFAVALHAVWNNFPRDTDTVLIIGGGTIGICTVAALRVLGSKARIIVLYKYPFQADLARHYGADAAVKLGQEEELAHATGAKFLKPLLGAPISLSGPAITFDCVGSRASLDLALRLTGTGGRIVLVGLASIPGRIDWTPVWLKELKIVGTYSYAVEDYEGRRAHTFQMALDFMARKEVELAPLVTHKFRIDDYRKALEWVTGKGRKNLVKAVFDFTPSPAGGAVLQ